MIEQLKYLTSCLKKLGQAIDLNEAGSGKLPEVIDYLISIIKRSEIDITFRKYVRFRSCLFDIGRFKLVRHSQTINE